MIPQTPNFVVGSWTPAAHWAYTNHKKHETTGDGSAEMKTYMLSDTRRQSVRVILEEMAEEAAYCRTVVVGAACCKTVVVVAEAARNTCPYRTRGELGEDDTQAQAEGGL